LMTNLIMPALLNAESARIVSLSSVAHQQTPVLFEDINFTKTGYFKWIAYGQAKTANSLFAMELDKRLKRQGIRAYAVHPGVIMTPLMRHLPEHERAAMADNLKTRPSASKTVPQGAATEVYAATAPELENMGGVYLADCQVCEVNDEENSAKYVRSWAVDPAMANRLWTVSEEMVGQSFLN